MAGEKYEVAVTVEVTALVDGTEDAYDIPVTLTTHSVFTDALSRAALLGDVLEAASYAAKEAARSVVVQERI